MVGLYEVSAFHHDVHPDGRPLTVQEREEILRPYLPRSPRTSSRAKAPASTARRTSTKPHRRKPMRDFLNNQLHVLVYTAIHTLFSIYVRLRRVCHAIIDRVFAILYYHHRTPELIKKDVKGLSRLPQHLSVILDFNEDGHNGSGLEDLVNDVCEIAAWSASAGIPILSIYERTGVLKNYIPQTHRSICRTFQAYFGRHKPTLSLRAPHLPSFSPPSSPSAGSTPGHLSILLLSADDGRNTLVDLTKTLAEMSQRGKISPADISPELIDAEISESVVGEPDLLVLFGPDVELKGYPPWQIRLTEIFHIQDNTSVGYQVFLRALHHFAKAQMRLGR
ncbi:Decaprenyl diphosphate synthase-like protein [Cryomyces antarcticus]